MFWFTKHLISLLTILLTIGMAGCAGNNDDTSGTAEANSMPLLKLEGGSYEIGVAHGRQLREQIQQIISIWKNANAKSLGVEPDEFVQLLLEGTDYLTAIKMYTPWLLSEVRGIADGAGLDFNSVLAFQLLDESGLNGKRLLADKCSAVGIDRSGGNPALVAQNMDLEGFRHGYQVMLHIKNSDTGIEQLVFTCAGLIGTLGMNNHGVGVCVNALTQLDHQLTGLPVAYVIRGLLEQPGQEQAVDFVKSVHHASGQNYMIGGPERVVSFECSHGEVVQYQPENHTGMIFHTNHPLANRDYTDEHRAELAEGRNVIDTYPSTIVRFETVERMLSESSGVVDPLRVKEILSSGHPDYPVCDPHDGPDEGSTFGSAIMVFGDTPEMHVSNGPPNVAAYELYGFK